MPRALVIDDEQSANEIVRYFLSDAGFQVETATSGAEGLQKALRTRPDVVIVDVMMPEMDGYEVCRRLHSDPRLARVLIVVLTARGQPVDRGMALRSGADLYVAKPAKGHDLVQQIQNLLNGRSAHNLALGYQIMVLRLAREVGATTLVTNLALCLAGEAGRLTLAADMVLPDGRVASRLGLLPAESWLESPAANFDRLASCLVHHSRGLFALPAPAALPQAGLPGPKVVDRQLQTLREWLDYVVLDTPLNLGPWAPALIGSSPLILLLLRADEVSLQKAQASLAAIKRLGSRTMQIWPVLNMVQPEQEAFRQQAEEILSLPVMAMLPWSPEEREVGPSNHKPLLLRHPKSPLAAAIRDLARQIVHMADIEAGAEGKQG